MRRPRRAVQGNLLEPDSPAPVTTGEQRDHLIELLAALVREVMTDPSAQAGGDHESDHA